VQVNQLNNLFFIRLIVSTKRFSIESGKYSVPDPDPYFLGLLDPASTPDHSINKQNFFENLDFYCFVNGYL
jgi:hypothetical protein